MLAPMDTSQSAERVNSQKRELRAATAARLRPPTDSDAEAVRDRVLALPEAAQARRVAAYASLGSEISTRPLLDALQAAGAEVLLPVLLDDGRLSWAPYPGWSRLVPGRLGTSQPPGAAEGRLADVDLVVLPALAVDGRGRRLGRGGGSYDRALATRSAGSLVVAVVADEAVVAEVPVAPHDQPVDVVITPTRTIRPRPDGPPRMISSHRR